jgi:hypothetical protein
VTLTNWKKKTVSKRPIRVIWKANPMRRLNQVSAGVKVLDDRMGLGTVNSSISVLGLRSCS